MPKKIILSNAHVSFKMKVLSDSIYCLYVVV